MVSIQNSNESSKPSQYQCHKCGCEVPQLWQDDPPDYIPGGWRQNREWTESLAGYAHKAKTLAHCMRRNARKYCFEATINFGVVLCPKCHRAIWKQIVRRLQNAGVECLWKREIATSNKIHVHFTISNLASVEECRRLFERALPTQDDFPCRLHVDEINTRTGWIDYFCKHGKKWEDKRILFRRATGLQAVGFIGKFWARKPDDIWKEYCEVVQTVQAGRKLHGMAAVLREAVALAGEWFTPKSIRWRLCFFAQSDTVTAWREELIAHPPPLDADPPRPTATHSIYGQSQHQPSPKPRPIPCSSPLQSVEKPCEANQVLQTVGRSLTVL